MWSFRRGLATAAAGKLRLPRLIYSPHPATDCWSPLAESKKDFPAKNSHPNYWNLIEDPELAKLIKLYDENCRCRKERKTSVGNLKKDHKKSKSILSQFQYRNSIEETEKISSNKSKPHQHNIIEDKRSSLEKSPPMSARNSLNKSKLDIKDPSSPDLKKSLPVNRYSVNKSQPDPIEKIGNPVARKLSNRNSLNKYEQDTIEEIFYPVSSSSSSDIENSIKYKPNIIREISSAHNKPKKINLSKFKMYSKEEITSNLSKHHHSINEAISHSGSSRKKLKKSKVDRIEETSSPVFKESSMSKRKKSKRKPKREPESRKSSKRKSGNELKQDLIEEISSVHRKSQNKLKQELSEEIIPEGRSSRISSSSNRNSESKIKQDLIPETSSGGDASRISSIQGENKPKHDPTEETQPGGDGSKKASSSSEQKYLNKLMQDLIERKCSGKPSSSNRKQETKLKQDPIENTSSLEFKKLSSSDRRSSEKKSQCKETSSPGSPDLGVYIQYKKVNFSSENIRRMSKRRRSTTVLKSRKSKESNSSQNNLTSDSTASQDRKSSKDRKTRKSRQSMKQGSSFDRKVKFKDSRSILSRNSSHQKARHDPDETKPPKGKPGKPTEVAPSAQRSLRTILYIDHYLSQNPMSGSSLHEAFSNFNFEPIDLLQHKKDFLASLSEHPIETRNSWPKIWPKVLEQSTRKAKSEDPSLIKKRFKRRLTRTHFLPIQCKYHSFNVKNFPICGVAVEKDKTVACQTKDLPAGSDLCNLCDPSGRKEEPLPVEVKQRLDREVLHRYYQQMCQRESNSVEVSSTEEKPLKTKDKKPQGSNAAWHCSTWGKMRRQLEICQAAIELCGQVIEAQHRLRRIKSQNIYCKSVPSYETVMRYIRARSSRCPKT